MFTLKEVSETSRLRKTKEVSETPCLLCTEAEHSMTFVNFFRSADVGGVAGNSNLF